MKSKEVYEPNIEINKGTAVGTNEGNITNINNDLNEIMPLLRELVAAEMQVGQQTARVEMEKRFNEILDLFYKKMLDLKVDVEKVKSAISSPAVQFDLREAELQYIKNGSEQLKSILTNIMIKRIEVNDEELLRLVLSESISVAPKLLESHMKTLSLAFVLLYTKWVGIGNKSKFYDRCRETIVPLLDGISTKDSDFQHLSYSGVAEIQISSRDYYFWLKQYSGIFSKGFDITPNSDIERIYQKHPNIFCKCLNDLSKYQFNASDYEVLDGLMRKNCISDQDKKIIKEYHDNYIMDNDSIKNDIINNVPEMSKFFSYLEGNTPIMQLMLTSVGIVIAIQYCEYKTGDKFDYSIWI